MDEPSSASRGRRILVGVVGVLAVLAVVASVVAVWARAVLFDSDRVAAIVDEALSERDVSDALAARLTDQALAAANVDDHVEALLPDALQPLRPALVGGLRGLLLQRTESLLARNDTRALLTEATRRAHAAAMRLLQGEGLVAGLSIDDGEVSLNVLPVLGRVMGAAQGLGLFRGVELPELTFDGEPSAQIAALEGALGRALPDDFGQLVVYRSETLAEAQQLLAVAQRGMVLFKRAVAVILAITAGLLAATVVLARDRRRAVLVLGIGATAALLVTRRVVQQIVADSPTLVVEPGARAAIASVVKGLAASLVAAVTVLVVVGLVAAATAFLSGPSDVARRLRSLPVDHRRAGVAVGYALGVAVLATAGLTGWSLLLSGGLAAASSWLLWSAPSGAPVSGRPASGE